MINLKKASELDFETYKRKGLSFMAPWEPLLDMDGISVSSEDRASGSPREGDMIAINPKNDKDLWLVSKKYFDDNLEEVKVSSSESLTFIDRLKLEAKELSEKLNKLNSFMSTNSFVELDRPNKDLLYEQSRCMSVYLQLLGKRLELNGSKFEF